MQPTSPVTRRRLPGRMTLALLLGALLTTGLAAPARAERYIHRDPGRDVRKVQIFSTGDDGFVRAPRHRQGDFVKVKIWHQVRAVRVVGKFRRLDRIGGGMMQLVQIRTPDGIDHGFTVFAGPGMWKGATDDRQDECVIGHKVNYERDRWSMRISRSCLGRPRWVRVGVGFIEFGKDALFADDAQLRRVRTELTLSPRLDHA